MQAVAGKGANLHRISFILKDDKKIDVSFSSKEEQELWISSIRDFQMPTPVLKLPEGAKLNQE
jgi:hypothetical protein